ncbi:trans-sulfuration enzyme family protein [Glycomyces algeriensis]|uniref:homocysteine desulfhydrase n=1 Tax=Glycomyces algeriensis TaxID=256037 RepID=A0A9W6G5H6_9ACTN|nr:aminotransferase class I/II-fold pyridoxal phosphate-dependent enzyme [Glycomyces algeriensis]MDA1367464.1 aminotransferase class I/II-fold pyridoxal phosphate-dependent enzyme [Glycomyces algeriensis]MDR7353173.1 cystathionine gamma-synthase/cystathionine gamma-lyase/cystathionine beta-lyase [Glycomyces algeriensis]GLI40866.1 cystathionine beta-lyase [Glycomyces algeriensis]
MTAENVRFETLAVHAAEPRPAHGRSVVFPIYQGTVYEIEPGGGVDYIRYSNTPTQNYLQEKLAALEGAEAAVATASGMAAISTALRSVLGVGDRIIVAGNIYGGTHALLNEESRRSGWGVDFVDADDPAAWAAALTPETKAVYVESITNPLIRVGDLAGLAAFAREHGLTSIIDNTFPTPMLFRPHSIGYDLVCHSATKGLNGHSDLVAGVVTGSAERIEHVRHFLMLFGGSIDPHAAFLLSRGLKTLAIRVKAQGENALALARFLEGHSAIAEVHYPGLESHPDHARALELFSGFGSMLAFRPVGGLEAAERLLKSLQIPYSAASLGGVESLVTRPAISSHVKLTAEERAAAGIADDLIRFSTGIEAAEDLIEDFGRALGE